MNPGKDSWKVIEDLYQAALDRPAEERAAFLDEACPNPEIRREVESLLAFAVKNDSLLNRSPWSQSGGLELGANFWPYRIEEKIGAGGMGEVYRARDKRLARDVALKILPPSLTGDAERRARFVQEAQSAARLNHPNIVTVYDIGERDGRIFIAMEHVEGKTLADLIPPTGLPAAQALSYAVAICGALAKAHAAGVIHRDLKPGNIMVTPDGIIKVLDFGLAKLLEQKPPGDETLTSKPETLSGLVMGTPAFMSPEQAEGKAVDARSDIFSFGALLYEMTLGRTAFGAGSIAATLAAVLHKDPEPLPAKVPRELSETIMRCLRKDPASRFQSMVDVSAALIERKSEPPQKPGSSIAVLPFIDMSAGGDNEYFSDGLSEEIINSLSTIDGLRVIARSSAFAFKGKNEDVRRIASVLDVAHVLEGSVRRSGNRVRVGAQLVNARDGINIWTQRYDREITDVFAVQDEIASAIAGALQLKLGSHSGSRHTPDIRAYEAYMLGVHHGVKSTPESIARAAQALQRAIELDPSYAAPHAMQGLLYLMMSAWTLRPAHEAMPLIRTSAERALQLDSKLSEAHGLLGVVAGVYDYDWRAAERHFEAALGADRVSDFARTFYAQYYLLPLGRTREAIEQMQRVLEPDPLNVLNRSMLGFALHAAGDFQRSNTELAKGLESEGAHWAIYSFSTQNYLGAGKVDDARAAAENAYRLAPWQPQVLGAFAALLSLGAETERAGHVLQQLKDLPSHRVPVGMTMYHLVRSEPENTIDCLERSIEQRDMWAARFPRFQLAKILRSSPRWSSIMRRMNLLDAI
jgi:serine/threonine-protein kinase